MLLALGEDRGTTERHNWVPDVHSGTHAPRDPDTLHVLRDADVHALTLQAPVCSAVYILLDGCTAWYTYYTY